MRRLDQQGRAVRMRYLKPLLVRPQCAEAIVNVCPHGKAPRSALTSLAKILVWLMEEWYAHLFLDKNGRLLICDRYYHDLLIDPMRYRYGGPLQIARLVGKLMPQPTLWVLLDAPGEVLQARKQEVTRQESARQRQAYLAFVSQQRQYAIVDASQLLDKVTADVERVVAAIDCASAPMEKP
jgi:thymidylate kinase